MRINVNQRAFSFIELMVGLSFTVVVLLSVFNFYNLVRKVNSAGMAGQTLVDAANLVISKIMLGSSEPSGMCRLSEGVAYCIGSGAGCSSVATNQLHFWGTDGIERWYKLNDSATSLIYHHPTAAAPAGADETVYTAPRGSTITLLFWVPTTVGTYTACDVNVSVILTQNVWGKNVQGAASTLINLRNHP